jgi:hypothetical protein
MGRVADRVYETSTTTGTGNITLAGAVAQYVSFNAAFGVGVSFYYTIKGTTGTEWEVGEGYLSGSTTLVRSQVYASSNAGALVSFTAATLDVFVTVPAMEVLDKGVQYALRMNLAMQ